ncbi:MAG: cytochrome b/b6 domain-containing protein [Gammaproteobacteria bacterium]
MQFLNTPARYGLVARLAHWTSVTLVGWLFLGISGLDVPPKVHARDAVVANHAAVGLALLALMTLRFAWRRSNPNPVLRYRLAPWHRALVLGVHRSLYLLVAAECTLGLAALAAAGAAVPVVGTIMAPDDALAGAARAWHDGVATALLLLVAVHASSAVVNQIVAGGEAPAPRP